MADGIRVPVKSLRGERWGHLSALWESHSICGETVHVKENYSFAGEHRVRLYTFKKNVHWRIPDSVPLDISNVAPATAPRRHQRR
jgi:hypothetical protein